jgi:hypothetical protein
MNKIVCLLIVVLSLVPATRVYDAAKTTTWVTVSAGAFDRTESVVSFELPAATKAGSYALKDRAGKVVPLQVDYRGQATFILDSLKAGETKEYQVISTSSHAAGGVSTAKNGEGLDLSISNQKAFSFVGKPVGLPDPSIKPVFLRGGYIYPIYTPSGVLVSDDYPSDHYHHHGIWFAWTKTEFEGGHPDFWNVDDGTGRVDFKSIGTTWSGAVHAGFTSRQDYVALTGPTPKTALNESWDVRLYKVGQGARKFYLFDLVATQSCATSSPLVLDEYRYGGMGIRGHREWKDKSKVTFLTSEGKSRADGNATRGRWFRMSGPVASKVVGIAVLDHPSNFRAPQPMRLNPDDPFFNYGPSQMGRFEIKPGEQFVLRYRYIISDGPDDAAELNRLWNDYANPPTVAVKSR